MATRRTTATCVTITLHERYAAQSWSSLRSAACPTTAWHIVLGDSFERGLGRRACRRVLSNVSSISIKPEFIGVSETVGVDGVIITRRPRARQIAMLLSGLLLTGAIARRRAPEPPRSPGAQAQQADAHGVEAAIDRERRPLM